METRKPDSGNQDRTASELREALTKLSRAEIALEESRQAHRTLLEQLDVGVFLADLDGRILQANRALALIVGKRTTGDVVGVRLSQMGWKLASSGWNEVRWEREDGAVRWLSVKTTLQSNSEGKPVATLGIVKDITDSKKAEQTLMESEDFNRLIVRYSPMGIIYLTADGEISFTNPACNRIFEIPEDIPSPLLGMNIFDLPLISDQPHVASSFRELMEEGKPQRDIELLYRSPLTGRDYTLLASATPRPAADGTILGSVVMIMDITERTRAEEQLRHLYEAVEQAGEAIVITDPDATILYVNPAFEAVTGYSKSEALGQNPRILKSGKQDSAFYESMWHTLLAGRVWRGELINKRKNGTLYRERATISPIKNERGETVNYVAVKRDVTGEVALQKQLLQAQKMEAIGTLAGGMAHDFNNLLTIILGYADLLAQRKKPGDPEREKLYSIRNAARDGSNLVNRILTFSRKAESRTRLMDLNEEIRRFGQLVTRTVPKMIEIEFDLSMDLWAMNGDPAQIEQVLLNLAVNAQQAMPEGGRLVIETENVTIDKDFCGIHAGTKPGDYVMLSVSDTGMGIDQRIVDRIFEPFFTTKPDGQGTGLGLSMVHGIVSQHGGFVRCYSEVGVGTTFRIYFPAQCGEVKYDPTMTTEMPAFGTETVLLVDDERQIRDLAEEILSIAGYRVIIAGNGQEALEIYGRLRGEIDVVILDVIMPGMSGHQCLAELLKIDPQVKVLISSGYSANGAARNVRTGARGFIAKPYDTKKLLRAVRSVLDTGS